MGFSVSGDRAATFGEDQRVERVGMVERADVDVQSFVGQRRNKDGHLVEYPKDLPARVAHAVLVNENHRLPPLHAVYQHPVIIAERLIVKPGYDRESGVFLSFPESINSVAHPISMSFCCSSAANSDFPDPGNPVSQTTNALIFAP